MLPTTIYYSTIVLMGIKLVTSRGYLKNPPRDNKDSTLINLICNKKNNLCGNGTKLESNKASSPLALKRS